MLFVLSSPVYLPCTLLVGGFLEELRAGTRAALRAGERGTRAVGSRRHQVVFMKIDPMRSLRPIDELIARTTNSRHLAMLQNFRTHIIAEVTGDLETIMATLVPEPTYHTYSPGSPLT